MSGEPPSPTALPLGGLLGCFVLWARVFELWGPNTFPYACMPCGCCVPWGWLEAVPGGGGLPLL